MTWLLTTLWFLSSVLSDEVSHIPFFYLKRFTFVNCSWFVLYNNDCIEKKTKPSVAWLFNDLFQIQLCICVFFVFLIFFCFVFVCFFFACSCLFYCAFIVNYLSNNNKTTYRNLFCDPKSLTVVYIEKNIHVCTKRINSIISISQNTFMCKLRVRHGENI